MQQILRLATILAVALAVPTLALAGSYDTSGTSILNILGSNDNIILDPLAGGTVFGPGTYKLNTLRFEVNASGPIDPNTGQPNGDYTAGGPGTFDEVLTVNGDPVTIHIPYTIDISYGGDTLTLPGGPVYLAGGYIVTILPNSLLFSKQGGVVLTTDVQADFAVPEPASLAVLACGVLGLGFIRRRAAG